MPSKAHYNKRQTSVMKHQFSEVPHAQIQRSSFDRSHGYKTTFDGGRLVPIFVDEALPGDTFNVKMDAFARLATPIAPFMDNLYLETFFFAVPNRLLWDNWEKFNGAQDNPGDSTDYLIPQVSAPEGGWESETLGDYFGIPTGVDISANALHFRAYNLIYNDWFRDQNLQDSVPVPKGDGPDLGTGYPLRFRLKRHDYFTSCLPWPQKGESVDIPLGQYAPIVADPDTDGSVRFRDGSTSGALANMFSDGSGNIAAINPSISPNSELHWASSGTNYIVADLSDATAATINQLRQAFQIQKMLERDARGGTRYTEIINAHFGVTSPDARLQRPEYLGGGRSYVNINPVAQTSATDVSGPDASPQGNLAAVGTSVVSGHGFTKSFTEHCVIIGLVNVRADLTYQQGLNRMWSRQTRYDYYWPALAHIGEQAVINKEIYADGTAQDEDVFGYQERYAEYRYKPSQITGKFRSSDPQSLDYWHLSQYFTTRPNLNTTFMLDNPPIGRVIAVQDEPQFLLDAYFSMRCVRPMPLYGVPGLIDHF